MANEQNLRKLTSEEARKIGSKGGKASVKARKERKLMSQIYADFLAQEHDIEINGEMQKVDGAKYMKLVADAIIQKGGSPAVSLLKEIRESTEGSKVHLDGKLDIPVKININPVKNDKKS